MDKELVIAFFNSSHFAQPHGWYACMASTPVQRVVCACVCACESHEAIVQAPEFLGAKVEEHTAAAAAELVEP